MATLLLSAAGAAIGGMTSGTVLGLTGAVIGRAVGATFGRMIDQSLLGQGSDAVQQGKVDRFRLSGASEGSPIAGLFGRMRIGGQVIWASRFEEHVTQSGGGKGAPSSPTVTSYSYSVSLAVALCEGEISRVGRVWADGVQIARDEFVMRVYTGAADQMPDPKMEAVEGTGEVPAYRGIAYVVIEDMDLSPFGNRVPQFSFEVVRPAQPKALDVVPAPSQAIQAVALMPGTGEYTLATTPVTYRRRLGEAASANVNSPSGRSDLETSLEDMRGELPNCSSVSLVVSWFGDDLRAGSCTVQPKVEQRIDDGVEMPWTVSGLTRGQAVEIGKVEDRSIYGGTPADKSVLEAIEAIQLGGQRVMFYPFLLMEILAGNSKPDPWSDSVEQPTLPWRGRMTGAKAPGILDSSDGTAAANAEIMAFFGSASASDFSISSGSVTYSGPQEWRYRRFILHCAALCAAAGGVDAFCIGSEMRGLTQLRDDVGFPAVAALKDLAAEVRAILPNTKLTYAADWTEYFGYHPQDGTGDVYFHLDPLWSDANIDAIGIDNYAPLSDWRDGRDHADAAWPAIHDLGYLQANIEGGEGYDWYYGSTEARDAQIRLPIEDGAYDEPWVYRYKDIRNWWQNTHHDRIDGLRAGLPTTWNPQSKPIWFTEIGCAAIDKGTNQPNRFLDVKSVESGVPYYSTGQRDDLIQTQYLRALIGYWTDPTHNPTSNLYSAPMIDMTRAHVWAWDARPWPAFPNNQDLWSDGENHGRGHWLTGRMGAQPLSSVVAEICEASGVTDYDVSELFGFVRGYVSSDVETGRARMQPLMLAYGFEVVEQGGKLIFRSRNAANGSLIETDLMAVDEDDNVSPILSRQPEAESTGRVRLTYVEADGAFETRVSEATFPDVSSTELSQSELALSLTRFEGRGIVERWLAEARVARDSVKFALPPSRRDLGAGSIVTFADGTHWRIDRLEEADVRKVEAVRVEDQIYEPSDAVEEVVTQELFVPPVPVTPIFLDLPLLSGEELAHAPYIAVAATPWPGSVALYGSSSDSNYTLNKLVEAASIVGELESPLFAARPGVWDRGVAMRVRLANGNLSSASLEDVLNGANIAAVGSGDGANWEVVQFADANLVAPDQWDISMRLRGQVGTEAGMPEDWPVGSLFVLLNGLPQQIDLASSARGLARHYRVGPAGRGYDDASYTYRYLAFDGIGLRPYAPSHLRATRSGGDLELSWIRRTRIDGDSWQGTDVPLGEDSESYLIQVRDTTGLRRTDTSSVMIWNYTAAMQANDGVTASYTIDVAQISERFGPGPFTRIEIND
jgi:hypothetical protein